MTETENQKKALTDYSHSWISGTRFQLGMMLTNPPGQPSTVSHFDFATCHVVLHPLQMDRKSPEFAQNGSGLYGPSKLYIKFHFKSIIINYDINSQSYLLIIINLNIRFLL